MRSELVMKTLKVRLERVEVDEEMRQVPLTTVFKRDDEDDTQSLDSAAERNNMIEARKTRTLQQEKLVSTHF